ncbi:hypothetical protein D3C76_1370540 [compost metagenome]
MHLFVGDLVALFEEVRNPVFIQCFDVGRVRQRFCSLGSDTLNVLLLARLLLYKALQRPFLYLSKLDVRECLDLLCFSFCTRRALDPGRLVDNSDSVADFLDQYRCRLRKVTKVDQRTAFAH